MHTLSPAPRLSVKFFIFLQLSSCELEKLKHFFLPRSLFFGLKKKLIMAYVLIFFFFFLWPLWHKWPFTFHPLIVSWKELRGGGGHPNIMRLFSSSWGRKKRKENMDDGYNMLFSLKKFPAGCVCVCVSTHLQLEATMEKQTHTPLHWFLIFSSSMMEQKVLATIYSPRQNCFFPPTRPYVRTAPAWDVHTLCKARVL